MRLLLSFTTLVCIAAGGVIVTVEVVDLESVLEIVFGFPDLPLDQ